MATRVWVTRSDDPLSSRARSVQNANRNSQLQREYNSDLKQRIQRAELSRQDLLGLQAPIGGNPRTDVSRRPAAQRGAPPSVFPVWITTSWLYYEDRADSWLGLDRGLEIWPVYNPSTRVRLTGSEPLISWPAGSQNDEGIWRELMFLFPINGQSAIVTYMTDFNINLCPVGYENFDETVTTYSSRDIKCAVVGLTSAREIDAPPELIARLDYLHPKIPDASYPRRIRVYKPSSIAPWYPDELVGYKFPIQLWYPEDAGYPGYAWAYGYDSSRPYSMQNMMAYGIGNLTPAEDYEYGRPGFGITYHDWVGYHTNSLWSAGIYDVLLRYDKSIQDGDTAPGPFIYDEGHWDEEYDIPVIEKYLSLNQFKGGWVSIDNQRQLFDAFGNAYPQDTADMRIYKYTKNASIETVRELPDITTWKEVKPSYMKNDFALPTAYRPIDFYEYLGLPGEYDAPNYAYNWGNEAYCKSQLRQLGFKDEDMKP